MEAPTENALDATNKSIVVSAKAEQRTVSATVTNTGTIAEGEITAITPTEAAGATRPVITAHYFTPGEQVTPGSILGSVSGRPLFVVRSNVPLYRQLHLGDSGPDVLALQAELSAWGYVVAADGLVGPDMIGILKDMYLRADAPEPYNEVDVPTPAPGNTQIPKPASTVPTIEPDKSTTLTAPARITKDYYFDPNEMVQIPADSGTIVALGAIGSVVTPENPFLRVQTSPNLVTARIGATSIDRFTVGKQVAVNAGGTIFTSTVTSVGDFVESDGTKIAGYDIDVSIPEPVASPTSVGSVVTVSSTGTEVTGTAVPLTALRFEGESAHVLTEAEAGGGPKKVDVVVRAESDGWAVLESTPAVEPGSTVIVSP